MLQSLAAILLFSCSLFAAPAFSVRDTVWLSSLSQSGPAAPPPLTAPTIEARGQVAKVFVRVSDYASNTPDSVEVQLSADDSSWTYSLTTNAPALDTAWQVPGTYSYSGGAWVRLRYQSGGTWSDWSNHDKLDVTSTPPTPDVGDNGTGGDIFSAEYVVNDYFGTPLSAIDSWRIEYSSDSDGGGATGPWTLWSDESTAPDTGVTQGFSQPDFGSLAPNCWCRFRYHDAELNKTSAWTVVGPWSEP